MSNVQAVFNFPESVAVTIKAYAALQIPPTTLEALVMEQGVTGALSQAMQSEVRSQVNAGTVGDDVKQMVVTDFNSVWNSVWGAYIAAKQSADSAAKFVPDSILIGIQARASKVSGPSAPAPSTQVAGASA